ncbi:molecular chaperone [Klebsiella oxytoca]|uniref:fimbrial biogenesis chaperone n=1 Tax=Klebsiella oxytoca TaxID=571 RepID=UPI00157A9EB3|nr:molecular chaperone [Klebsiella oxytoca]
MNIWIKALALSAVLGGQLASAAGVGGITVGGTRLIYDGSRKEASLSVTNSSPEPYLVQSWAEIREDSAEKAPFIITPPLFRLDGNQQNVLRIVRAGGSLAEDRESLYWLNVKAIPRGTQQDNVNTLQIAVKNRIKLIYRPAALSGVPEEQTNKLRWRVAGNKVTVTNPTPFVMNFYEVRVGGREVKDVTYVLPMSEATFATPSGVAGRVSWKLINDYGGVGPEHTMQH